jgi:hypothetical protein
MVSLSINYFRVWHNKKNRRYVCFYVILSCIKQSWFWSLVSAVKMLFKLHMLSLKDTQIDLFLKFLSNIHFFQYFSYNLT